MNQKEWAKAGIAIVCIIAATYLYSIEKSGAGWLVFLAFCVLAF